MAEVEAKRIAAGWATFRAKVIGEDVPPVQAEAMRIAFFAGAAHTFASLMDALDDEEHPEVEYQRVEAMAREIAEFAEVFTR